MPLTRLPLRLRLISPATHHTARLYHRTAPTRYAYKDDQDKDSLSPRSSEYAGSSTDDNAAAQEQAFDPSKTSPEEQHKAADVQSGDVSGAPSDSDTNPLETSPANRAQSQARDPNEGGPTNAPGENRDRTSKAGGANKQGGGKSG